MKKLFLLAAGLLLVNAQCAFSQASLADKHKVDISITLDGIEENITCIQDAREEKQWYYVPNKPRLVIVKSAKSSKGLPSFSLVKYQAKDPQDPEKLLEGGVMQAAVNLSLPDGGLNKLKEGLAAVTKQKAAEILLAPLSMSNGKFAVYAPGGELMGDAPLAPDIGPSFANQAIPIQINLTRLGADFSDALIKTGGGILVTYIFDYNGLTPPCGFKVTVDWDQTYKHFSTNTKAKASYGKFFWSANAQTDIATVRDMLTTNKCIKVESIAGEAFKSEEIDKFLMPILESINKEIFNIEAPAEVEPAKAAEPSLPSKKWGFTAALSFSLKKVDKVKKGKTVYDMSRQLIVARQTVVGGLIGLGNYAKEIQDQLITVMPQGNWASAWYSLPDVGSAIDIGVTEISVTVKVVDKNGKIIPKVPQQNAKWTARADAWVDAKKNERNSLVFALADVYENFKGKESELFYYQKLDVTQKVGNKTSKLAFENTLPMFDGEAAISTPMANIACVEVNANYLTWYGDKYPDNVLPAYKGQASSLTAVAVSLESSKPKNKVSATLSNKVPELYLLLATDDSGAMPITTGKFEFNTKAGKKTLTYKDLDGDRGSDIFLTDDDYLIIK